MFLLSPIRATSPTHLSKNCDLFQIVSRNVPEWQKKSTDLPSDGRKGDLRCGMQQFIQVLHFSFIYNVLYDGWHLERLGHDIKISLLAGCSNDT